MALTLEEIKKLPPKERILRLKEFEEEQKKAREEQEKKEKQEAEEIVNKSIEEITKEDQEQEAEEKLKEEEEEKEKKKKESLEEIAEKAPAKKEDDQRQYQIQQDYLLNLSRRPTTELYSSVTSLRESFEQKGYLNPTEAENLEKLRGAFYEKERADGYNPNERSRNLMTEAEKILDDLKNPLKKVYR